MTFIGLEPKDDYLDLEEGQQVYPHWNIAAGYEDAGTVSYVFPHKIFLNDTRMLVLINTSDSSVPLSERYNFYLVLFDVSDGVLSELDRLHFRGPIGNSSTAPSVIAQDWDFNLYPVSNERFCFTWVGGSGTTTGPTYASIFSWTDDTIVQIGSDILLNSEHRLKLNEGYVVDERWVVQGIHDGGINRQARILVIDADTATVSEDYEVYPLSSSPANLSNMSPVSPDRFVVIKNQVYQEHYIDIYELNASRSDITLVDSMLIPVADFDAVEIHSDIEWRETFYYGDHSIWPFLIDSNTVAVYGQVECGSYTDDWIDSHMVAGSFDISNDTIGWNDDVVLVTTIDNDYYKVGEHNLYTPRISKNTDGPVTKLIWLSTYGGGYIPNNGYTLDVNQLDVLDVSPTDKGTSNRYWVEGLPIEYVNPEWGPGYEKQYFETSNSDRPELYGSQIVVDGYYLSETVSGRGRIFFLDLVMVPKVPTRLIDVRKWAWNIKSITINYDGGLSSNALVSKAFPYTTQIEVPIEPQPHLFVVSTIGNDVDLIEIDYSTGEDLAVYTLGNDGWNTDYPHGLAYDGVNFRYVTILGGVEAIFTIDLQGNVLGTIPNNHNPVHTYGITHDGTGLWLVGNFSSQGLFTKVNASTGDIMQTIQLDGAAQGYGEYWDVAYNGDGGLWVTDADNDIHLLDIATEEVIVSHSNPIGNHIINEAIEYDTENDEILLSDNSDGRIVRVSPITGAILGVISTYQQIPNNNLFPNGMAFFYD